MARPSLKRLAGLLPSERWLVRPEQLAAYESDAVTAFRTRPLGVAIPETEEEVIALVRLCREEGMPFVARGSGTSFSGGSLPVANGVVIALNRLDRILQLDPALRIAVVQPGVINTHVFRGGGAARLILLARSVEPVDLHHRRQRGLQLRRRALPEIWDDVQSRARPEGGAGQR